jgi:PKD repeat protein
VGGARLLPFLLASAAGCGRIGFDVTLVADAGGDQQLTWVPGCTPVTIDPKGSYDRDGALVSCTIAWDSGSTTGSSCNLIYGGCFPLPGIYPVELTVVDDAGNVATDTAVITIIAPNHPPPSDGLTHLDAGPDITTAVGDLVRFDFSASWNADGRNYRQYSWDFGDGTMLGGTALDDQHAYAAVGTYQVVYTLENTTIPVAQWPTSKATVTVR